MKRNIKSAIILLAALAFAGCSETENLYRNPDSALLSKITLKSTVIDATGTMGLSTGAVTAAKKASETGTVELTTDGTITAEGVVKDILLVPADGSEGKKDITIILTIDGKVASA